MNNEYTHIRTLLEARKTSLHRSLDGDETIVSFMMNRAETVVRYIQQHCKPWLQESGLKMVWRGDGSFPKEKDVTIKTLRQDRRPRDSLRKHHDDLNRSIEINGKIANRSNGMFVTGDRRTAQTYEGVLVVAFPVGKFNYTWSPVIGDAAEDFNNEHRAIHVSDTFNWVTHNFENVLGNCMAKWDQSHKGPKQSTHPLIHPLIELSSEDEFDRELGELKDDTVREIVSQALADKSVRDIIRRILLSPLAVRIFTAHIAQIQRVLDKRQSLAAKELTVLAFLREVASIGGVVGGGYTNAQERLLVKRWKPILQQTVEAGAPEYSIGKESKNVWLGDDGTLQRAIKSQHEIIISAMEVVLCSDAFAQAYVIPMLRGKKLNPEAAYRAYSQ